jgi:putative membrane protein insertion efficiency factor
LKTGILKIKFTAAVTESFVLVIRLYQAVLSPLMGGQCRFMPTCSNYAIEAVRQFGAVKGGWLALKRILKCHPLGSKGYDPTPTTGVGAKHAK